MQSAEIQLDDRLLWAGAVASGIYLLSDLGSVFANPVQAMFLAPFVALMAVLALTVVLTPLAWFLQIRTAEGRTSTGAMLALFWRTIVGLVGVAAVFFIWLGVIPTALSALPVWLGAPLAFAVIAFTVWSLVRDARTAVRLRRERAKLNTIDISRGRDIQLK